MIVSLATCAPDLFPRLLMRKKGFTDKADMIVFFFIGCGSMNVLVSPRQTSGYLRVKGTNLWGILFMNISVGMVTVFGTMKTGMDGIRPRVVVVKQVPMIVTITKMVDSHYFGDAACCSMYVELMSL